MAGEFHGIPRGRKSWKRWNSIRTRRPPGLRVVQPRSVSWREHGRPSAALHKKQILDSAGQFVLRIVLLSSEREIWFAVLVWAFRPVSLRANRCVLGLVRHPASVHYSSA